MKIEKNNKYYKKALKRESEFWEGTNTLYQKHPEAVIEYEQLNRFDNKNLSMLDFFKELGYFENVLSIGSGDGSFEFMLMEKNIIKNICFVDISEEAIDKIKRKAIKLKLDNRINTKIADLNFIELEENKYDLVCCLNVLHHIINLEECIFELNKSLKADGKILIDDFIGEKKFNRSNSKIKLLEAFQTHIKEKYNIETKQLIRTNPKVLTNNCPFEAVRSHELYSIIKYYFGTKLIKENKYGFVFDSRQLICKNPSNIFFDELRKFDDFAKKYDITIPNRVFGVYQKSNKQYLENVPRNTKEIKENIKVSIINEKIIMQLGFKIAKKLPRLHDFLKKLYFMIRK